ncbi:MAG: hypothetical protein H6934_09075 [Burkholderiaceae bacterium]|nr:hypothetical protein [Burkholderiaceae bacterium]
MKLGIADTVATPADIEAGCQAAARLITGRGLTVDQAYWAVMARSNRERFDRRAAKAWDDAEDEAIRIAYHGAEPDDDPVLVPLDDDGRPAS